MSDKKAHIIVILQTESMATRTELRVERVHGLEIFKPKYHTLEEHEWESHVIKDMVLEVVDHFGRIGTARFEGKLSDESRRYLKDFMDVYDEDGNGLNRYDGSMVSDALGYVLRKNGMSPVYYLEKDAMEEVERIKRKLHEHSSDIPMHVYIVDAKSDGLEPSIKHLT